MTYSSGGLIQAADYNSLATSVNSLWGTGSGSTGYGQSTTLSGVSSAVTVASTEWAALISRINSMRGHQSGTTYAPTAPVSGGIITYLSDLSSTITTITTNKNLANANGTDATTNYDNATGWYTSSQRETSITFASGDAARYFFNAGGQIRISYSLTGGDNTKSTDWATLCTNVGTLVISANSFAKSGGGGNSPSTYNTGYGYYSLTTSYATIFQQYSTGSAGSYYANNYLQFQVKSNGTVGANGDKGSVIYVNTNFIDAAVDSTWPGLYGNPDQVDEVHGTLRMSVTIRPPSTTYLTSTWGTQTLAQVTNTATGQITATGASARSFVNNYTTSPWNLDTNGTFAVNGSVLYYIQPQYDFAAYVYMWGAGGAYGNFNNGYPPYPGPGGYSQGRVQFKAGYTYYIRCGEQGRSAGGGNAAGGGGAGGRGGGGGGYSAIFLNVEGFGSFIMAAGGGGGGGNGYAGGGGGGGGSSGEGGIGWPWGGAGGGSQTAGGYGSGPSWGGAAGGFNGYPWQGGNTSYLGAGGGGGYYGGGGGGTASYWDGPGGGGSGYINTTHVSSGTTITSGGSAYSGLVPQGYTAAVYNSPAPVTPNAGTGSSSGRGGVGRVVII